jgi:hypothetical protein
VWCAVLKCALNSVHVKVINRIVSKTVVQIKSGKRGNRKSFSDNLYRKGSIRALLRIPATKLRTYWKGEVFASVGLPQNLKDLKD